MYVRYQLECGHLGTSKMYPDQMVYCEECDPEGNTKVRLFAIETREWKTACQMCSFARWCGAAKTNAITTEAKHTLSKGHDRYITDFLQHPDKQREVISIYGRRFPRIISDRAELPAYPHRAKDIPDEPPF